MFCETLANNALKILANNVLQNISKLTKIEKILSIIHVWKLTGLKEK